MNIYLGKKKSFKLTWKLMEKGRKHKRKKKKRKSNGRNKYGAKINFLWEKVYIIRFVGEYNYGPYTIIPIGPISWCGATSSLNRMVAYSLTN